MTEAKLGRRAFALALPMMGLLTHANSSPASSQQRDQPRDVGRKFHADGTVMPFRGNTFIGHLPQQGEGFATFNALLNIYRQFPAFSFARKIALVPPSSYHVTLFGGVNESDRPTDLWPKGIDRGESVDGLTQQWLRRLRDRRTEPLSDFEFEVNPLIEPMVEGSPHVPLRGSTARTEHRLKALRDELSELTGIRRPDHERYRFHLTFGYVHQRLNQQESEELRTATARWISALPPRIRIPAVEFCRFEDMHAFEVMHRL